MNFYAKSRNVWQAEKRKTINGEDILYAMSQLGFDNYVEPLKLYLQKYRQVMKGEAGGSVEGYEVLSNDIMGISLKLVELSLNMCTNCKINSLIFL